jgi:hypothetical protein
MAETNAPVAVTFTITPTLCELSWSSYCNDTSGSIANAVATQHLHKRFVQGLLPIALSGMLQELLSWTK